MWFSWDCYFCYFAWKSDPRDREKQACFHLCNIEIPINWWTSAFHGWAGDPLVWALGDMVKFFTMMLSPQHAKSLYPTPPWCPVWQALCGAVDAYPNTCTTSPCQLFIRTRWRGTECVRRLVGTFEGSEWHENTCCTRRDRFTNRQ